jgi:hypothetical protein
MCDKALRQFKTGLQGSLELIGGWQSKIGAWDDQDRAKILPYDLDHDLAAVIRRHPSPASQELFSHSQGLGPGSRHIGQLNSTWIFVNSEMASDIDVIAGHGHIPSATQNWIGLIQLRIHIS